MDVNIRETKGGIRVNRPAESREEQGYEEQQYESEIPARPRKLSKGPWILAGTVVVVLLVLGVVFRDRLFNLAGKNTATSAKFQAVFLTNGQVYFGKLTDSNDRYAILEDIYYLQVTPVLQTKTEGSPGAVPNQQSQEQQQLSLVKLGNELHGPVDKMQINRDQILFIESLKDDGRVMQAIKDYESGAKK